MAQILFDSEKEIEDFLMDYQYRNNVCLITGAMHNTYERQVNLSKYGILDIVGVQYNPIINVLFIDIIEIKKHCIDANTFTQVSRYMFGVRKIEKEFFDFDVDVVITGYLVAPNIKLTDDITYLSSQTPNINIVTIDYDLYGGLLADFLISPNEKTDNSFDNELCDISSLCSDINLMYNKYKEGTYDTPFNHIFKDFESANQAAIK